MNEKALDNTSIEDVKKSTGDVKVFGDGDIFQLISKASSESQGWMKSCKAMEAGSGCVVQVTTQLKNPDGSYSIAEALTFVPNSSIRSSHGNKYISYDDVAD